MFALPCADDSCVLRPGDCIALLTTDNAPLFQIRSDGDFAESASAAAATEAAAYPAVTTNAARAPAAADGHALFAAEPAMHPAPEHDEPALKR